MHPTRPRAGRVRRPVLTLGLLVFVLFGTSGCVKAGISHKANEVHSLFYYITWLALPVFVFVEGMLLYCVVRYRKRGEEDGEPVQDYGNKYALSAFFAGPFLIVLVLLAIGEPAVAHVDALDPNPTEHLVITGFQWEWSANYVKENLTVSGKTLKKDMVMELPLGQASQITLKSTDVIHEFYVPDLLYMKNAVPGHPNTFSVTPTKLGTYKSQCAQYCGLWHSRMKFVLKVVTPADFKTWVRHTKKAIKLALATGCKPTGSSITLIAHAISWNKACIAVDPGKPFTMTIDNKDVGIAHDFAIWASPDLKKQLFVAPKISGPRTETFTVPALPPGRYYFQCNIHGPAMSGTLNVGNPPPPGSSPPPSNGG